MDNLVIHVLLLYHVWFANRFRVIHVLFLYNISLADFQMLYQSYHVYYFYAVFGCVFYNPT